MDFLKRNVAPISDSAWEEIDNTAKEVISSMLAGRRVLKVNGPKGIDFNVISDGRLENLKGKADNEVCYGTYKVTPLVESRIVFELPKWELDNIERGVKDPDLSNLEDACKNLALFEENAIFNGNKEIGIDGLIPSAGHTLKFGKNAQEILTNISEAKYALFESFAEMPFDLVVSAEMYQKLNVIHEGANVMNIVKKIIGGNIIRSKVIKGAVMIPHFDDDLEFTVGQDFSIGYEGDNGENVRLFATESFMLRILDEDKIVAFS